MLIHSCGINTQMCKDDSEYCEMYWERCVGAGWGWGDLFRRCLNAFHMLRQHSDNRAII